jgi:hypothetical protein
MKLIKMNCKAEKQMELRDFGTEYVGGLSSDVLNNFLDPCYRALPLIANY